MLNNEHATAADLPELKRYMRELKQFAVALQVGDAPLSECPVFAAKLARLDAELQALEMLVQRVARLEQAHRPESHTLGSMLKIRATEFQQRITEAHVQALGDYGAIAYPHPHEPSPHQGYPLQALANGIANEMFFRRASTIYGGTSEVQRGIIAKMLFQL